MSKLEAVFDKIKYDARELIGLYEAPVTPLGTVLSSAAAQYGDNLFTDPALLQHALGEAGAPPAEIYRMCLMTQVSGFGELLKRDPRTAQVDLDRYIQNAADETGFSRDTILRLTGDIVFALGGTMDSRDLSAARKGDFVPQTVAVVAQALYEEQLHAFQTDFDKAAAGASVKLDFDKLEPLVNAGIPQAKYFLGACLLRGIQLPVNEERGLELLQEAAQAGDSRAAAALGDYYYGQGGSDSLTLAYQYYTGFGAAALNPSRQAAVTGILNQKVFNGKLLKLCALLLAVCAVTVFWAPASALFSPCTGIGCAALVLEAALLVLGFLRWRARPYSSIYALPVAMSGVWFLYMLARFFL